MNTYQQGYDSQMKQLRGATYADAQTALAWETWNSASDFDRGRRAAYRDYMRYEAE